MATQIVRMALDSQGIPVGDGGRSAPPLWTVNGDTDFGAAVRSVDAKNVEVPSAQMLPGSALGFFLDTTDLSTLSTALAGGTIDSITATISHKRTGGTSVSIDVLRERPDNQNFGLFANFTPSNLLTSTSYTTYTTTAVTTDPIDSAAWTIAKLQAYVIFIDPYAHVAAPDYFVDQFYLTVSYTPRSWWSLTLPTMTLYELSLTQPSSYTLPFDIFTGGTLYPAGTVFTWAAASDPGDTGWWMTSDLFAGTGYIVQSTSRPAAPRGFTEITAFATGSNAPQGGFPGPCCAFDNKLVYASGGYTVGTTAPPIRVYDGQFDRPISSAPNASGSTVAKAVMTMLTANGTIYVATFDSGANSTNWVGRVFSLDLESGAMSQIGGALTTGHMPYALAWHAGRLWCGTNRQDSTAAGKIFYIRPGIDTAWTDDYTLSSSSMAGCTSLLSYKGKLYVGTSAAAATFATVLVRDTAGAYTTSKTGAGGTAAANNAMLALVEFSGNLYASFWNPDTPAVSLVYKFDNSSWSTAYTGSGSTIVPYLGFPEDGSTLLAIGGGVGYSGVMLKTADGTTWTDQSAFLPQGTPAASGLPVFGVVVH